jgi:hypothetical protein
MTITFLQPDGVPITAQQARQGWAATYAGSPSRPLGGRSGFRPGTAASTLSATSTTWTLTPCSAMIDPGAATHQGMYGWATDANITGTVTAADATYARKDIVYIQVNDSSSGDGSGAKSANVSYLAGTPSATPAAPTLPARSFLVGTIDVPKVGGGSPTATLNTARFASAGSAIHVFSTAERDGLDKFDGLTVRRMDVVKRPTETWDGAAWNRTLPAINAGASTDITSALGSWAISSPTGNSRPRIYSPDGVTAFMTGSIQYNGGTGSILNIPAPFAPADSATLMHVGTTQASNGSANAAGGASLSLGVQGGVLKIVYQSASVASGSFLPLAGISWPISS